MALFQIKKFASNHKSITNHQKWCLQINQSSILLLHELFKIILNKTTKVADYYNIKDSMFFIDSSSGMITIV